DTGATITSTDTGEQAASAVVFTEIVVVTDVSITKEIVPGPALEGGPLDYVLTVANGGPSVATGIQVTDALPAVLSLDDVLPSQGSCAGTTTVTCAIGALDPLGMAAVAIHTTPGEVGTVRNTAVVASSTFDPDLS